MGRHRKKRVYKNPKPDLPPRFYRMLPDAELAKLLGITKSTAAARRRKKGILRPVRPLTRLNWDDWIGVSDTSMARAVGVTRQAVTLRRKILNRLGDRPYNHRKYHPDTIFELIQDDLSRFEPMRFRALQIRVSETYPNMSDRTLWRYLNTLIAQGRVKRAPVVRHCSEGFLKA